MVHDPTQKDDALRELLIRSAIVAAIFIALFIYSFMAAP